MNRRLYYLMMTVGYLVSFVIMGIVLMWLLASCSMLVEKLEYRIEQRELDTLCCIPDPIWSHLCDGWILCAEPTQLKEIEE